MPKTERYTDAQLHSLACIVCGRTDGELLPAGHVSTEVRPGQDLAWAVASCPEHQGRPVMRAPTDTPDSTWLLNPQSYQPPLSSTLLLAAGYGWDAVRTPEQLGLATAERLLADSRDRPFLGPVLHSRRSECLYWLVRTGSTAHYPDECQLLGVGHWIAAPGDRAVHPDTVRWLHLSDTGVLTPAAWLAAALHDTHTHATPPGRAR